MLTAGKVNEASGTGNNYLGDDGVGFLCDAISEQSEEEGIKVLILTNTGLTCEVGTCFNKVLNSSCILETLVLSLNDIGTEGVVLMKEGALRSRTLRHLELRGANIDCEGAAHLAQVIYFNPDLERLDLRDNPIKYPGLAALRDCLVLGAGPLEIELDDREKELQPMVEEIRKKSLGIGEHSFRCPPEERGEDFEEKVKLLLEKTQWRKREGDAYGMQHLAELVDQLKKELQEKKMGGAVSKEGEQDKEAREKQTEEEKKDEDEDEDEDEDKGSHGKCKPDKLDKKDDDEEGDGPQGKGPDQGMTGKVYGGSASGGTQDKSEPDKKSDKDKKGDDGGSDEPEAKHPVEEKPEKDDEGSSGTSDELMSDKDKKDDDGGSDEPEAKGPVEGKPGKDDEGSGGAKDEFKWDKKSDKDKKDDDDDDDDGLDKPQGKNLVQQMTAGSRTAQCQMDERSKKEQQPEESSSSQQGENQPKQNGQKRQGTPIIRAHLDPKPEGEVNHPLSDRVKTESESPAVNKSEGQNPQGILEKEVMPITNPQSGEETMVRAQGSGNDRINIAIQVEWTDILMGPSRSSGEEQHGEVRKKSYLLPPRDDVAQGITEQDMNIEQDLANGIERDSYEEEYDFDSEEEEEELVELGKQFSDSEDSSYYPSADEYGCVVDEDEPPIKKAKKKLRSPEPSPRSSPLPIAMKERLKKSRGTCAAKDAMNEAISQGMPRSNAIILGESMRRATERVVEEEEEGESIYLTHTPSAPIEEDDDEDQLGAVGGAPKLPPRISRGQIPAMPKEEPQQLVQEPKPMTALVPSQMPVTKEPEPKTVTQELKPKTVTQESKPKTVTQESKPKTVTQESKPKAVTQESKPKTVTQESKPKTVTQESKPKTVTKESKPKTVTKETKPKSSALKSDDVPPPIPYPSKYAAVGVRIPSCTRYNVQSWESILHCSPPRERRQKWYSSSTSHDPNEAYRPAMLKRKHRYDRDYHSADEIYHSMVSEPGDGQVLVPVTPIPKLTDDPIASQNRCRVFLHKAHRGERRHKKAKKPHRNFRSEDEMSTPEFHRTLARMRHNFLTTGRSSPTDHRRGARRGSDTSNIATRAMKFTFNKLKESLPFFKRKSEFWDLDWDKRYNLIEREQIRESLEISGPSKKGQTPGSSKPKYTQGQTQTDFRDYFKEPTTKESGKEKENEKGKGKGKGVSWSAKSALKKGKSKMKFDDICTTPQPAWYFPGCSNFDPVAENRRFRKVGGEPSTSQGESSHTYQDDDIYDNDDELSRIFGPRREGDNIHATREEISHRNGNQRDGGNIYTTQEEISRRYGNQRESGNVYTTQEEIYRRYGKSGQSSKTDHEDQHIEFEPDDKGNKVPIKPVEEVMLEYEPDDKGKKVELDEGTTVNWYDWSSDPNQPSTSRGTGGSGMPTRTPLGSRLQATISHMSTSAARNI